MPLFFSLSVPLSSLHTPLPSTPTPPTSLMMDGQLVYIQSAISPDAVRGLDAAAGRRVKRGMKGGVGSGEERRGAWRGRGDAEDTVSGKQANEKECDNGGGVVRSPEHVLQNQTCTCTRVAAVAVALTPSLL